MDAPHKKQRSIPFDSLRHPLTIFAPQGLDLLSPERFGPRVDIMEQASKIRRQVPPPTVNETIDTNEPTEAPPSDQPATPNETQGNADSTTPATGHDSSPSSPQPSNRNISNTVNEPTDGERILSDLRDSEIDLLEERLQDVFFDDVKEFSKEKYSATFWTLILS